MRQHQLRAVPQPSQPEGSNTEGPSRSDLVPSTIIATLDPEVFKSEFPEQLGADVFVVSDVGEFFDLLQTTSPRIVFVDYRQFAHKHDGRQFTGSRLLQEVRSTPHTAQVPVWVMINNPQSHQSQWLIDRLGATGLIPRDPAAVSATLGIKPAAAKRTQTQAVAEAIDASELLHIEQTFMKYNAFGGVLHVNKVRGDWAAGLIQPLTTEAYTKALAGRMLNAARAQEFLADALAKKKRGARN